MGNPHLRFDEGRVRRSHPAVTHSPTLPARFPDRCRAATVRERWRSQFRRCVYIDDADFGSLFVKLCSYAPWGLELCLNGRE